MPHAMRLSAQHVCSKPNRPGDSQILRCIMSRSLSFTTCHRKISLPYNRQWSALPRSIAPLSCNLARLAALAPLCIAAFPIHARLMRYRHPSAKAFAMQASHSMQNPFAHISRLRANVPSPAAWRKRYSLPQATPSEPSRCTKAAAMQVCCNTTICSPYRYSKPLNQVFL